MFVNLSNHPCEHWDENQRRTASQWGEIVDVPFPQVSPESSEEEVQQEALKLAGRIIGMKPGCVLCQGEFTLCFQIVQLLLKEGIPCVAACSERICEEKKLPDGTIQRISSFRFSRFRRYSL